MPRRPAWLLPAIVTAGVAIVIAAVTALTIVLTGPGQFTLTGTLSIDSATAGGSLPEGFACTGAGTMSDIKPNLRVIVADGGHELIGKGELTSSFAAGPDACVFGLVVHNLPRDRETYLVQVSHRGEVEFTRDEAVSGIELSLNG